MYDVLAVLRYELHITTSTRKKAQTRVNPFVEIQGERGDTGKRKLLKSSSPGVEFQSGKTDIFAIDAVDLIRPVKLTIGHDNSTKGEGWHVERVIIKSQGEDYIFPCNR